MGREGETELRNVEAMWGQGTTEKVIETSVLLSSRKTPQNRWVGVCVFQIRKFKFRRSSMLPSSSEQQVGRAGIRTPVLKTAAMTCQAQCVLQEMRLMDHPAGAVVLRLEKEAQEKIV